MRIGLALSGGGFRATMFHLGVIRYLRDAGALPYLTHICAVSGGSVTAAHLLKNWDAYSAYDAQGFKRAARELIKFMQLDVRGRIIRRAITWSPTLIIPKSSQRFYRWRASRTGLLRRYYEHLFQDVTLNAVSGNEPDRPELHLLATGLTNYGLVAFTPRGILANAAREVDDPYRFYEADAIPLALAVSASSAFPGLFPPVRIEPWMAGIESNEWMPKRQFFTDGGVFDNLGLRHMLLLGQHRFGCSEFREHDFRVPAELPKRFQTWLQQSAQDLSAPVRWVVQLLSENEKAHFLSGASLHNALATLNRLMRVTGLYDKKVWPRDTLSDEAQHLLASELGSPFQQQRLHRLLLETLFESVDLTESQGAGGFDLIIVSDAGKAIETYRETKFEGMLRTALRATDVLQCRVGDLEIQSVMANTATKLRRYVRLSERDSRCGRRPDRLAETGTK